MSVESRVGKIEDVIEIMKDLLVSHNERLEDYFNALNRERQERLDAFSQERQEREESRKDFEFKLNALIDAQISNQDQIGELREASKSILKRVEKLENQ